MYGIPISNHADIFEDESTEIEEENVTLKDIVSLINDIIHVSETCHVLDGGVSMSFGNIPLSTFNKTLTKHLDVIDTLKREIKEFEKKNKLIITRLRSEEKKEKELTQKVKEETKPKRRKTELL
ncbi:hypothetical protein EDI_238380 [Entamoeba dispar SAW760]|uniref:Uncharacterized protein n=1 Tax=Entamoeba dispar (strain ATCC PRA-260 / SAW760) TaxID=370354 RepID=B0EA62_ENTDS|nr:uncharacterized protein EDI_238380 [Entamoeba dispar SAW760]XP_001741763.1 uncharacterized protein EDI_066090 [Entamoeba dispar SAW760]EDR21764.1 hypothetical protein EDI_066090 [Entamoeba dispar SAW760]EDR28576.1 hypothetical protein EDI_238380 [Entamoeba dispar SAW760]|eukprot:EDR21764.1 hypothetical protein EDI_066090 [Entamoeba dispar SAW760]